ncbi:MAG TPA: hypothetical protein O0W81_01810 [Methanocorpusculum sp.]|nr:hypothetical protein [Methanocorpusculum sp.]
MNQKEKFEMSAKKDENIKIISSYNISKYFISREDAYRIHFYDTKEKAY